MVSLRIGSVLRGLFDAVIRPRSFVAAQTSAYSYSRTAQVRQLFGLLVVYLLNLVLYAGPLTLAGFGVPAEAGTPPGIVGTIGGVIGDAETVWRLTIGFVQNSSFITALAAVTLVTYHLGVVVTRKSSGFVQSLHTVVYSTSGYLAGLFTVVWYLTTADGLATARTLVRNVQRAGIYAIIDLLGADMGLPSGRPDRIITGELSQTGTTLVAILGVLVLYYFYSLYLGARLNHRMDRASSVLVIVAVGLSPVVYIAGSILVSTLGVALVI